MSGVDVVLAQDVAFVIWTGDQPPHDNWKQTMRNTLQVITLTTLLMKKYFAKMPVFPVVGNHEAYPVNV